MKKDINKVKVISILLMTLIAIFITACSKRPQTEDEFKEAFFQDKTVFEDACNKALQYVWTDEDKKTGIVILYKYTNQLKRLGIQSCFLNKYRIVSIDVMSEKGDFETRYVRFCMTDAIDGYNYSDFYYSPTGEPSNIELGEYQEDLGMYYYKEEVTNMYECYTERLDDHWFLVKYHYFRY